MKKVVYAVLTILCLVIISGCLFYLFTGDIPTPDNIAEKVKKPAIDAYNDNVNTPNKDGKEFVFNAPKVKEAPEEALPADTRKSIYLYLDDDMYYSIAIPEDLEIVTDYNKYIYAKDSTFSVSVVSNASATELSGYVGIKQAVSLSPSLVRTEVGYKGAQQAAKLIVNDKAIVIRAYNNPVAFATALGSLQNGTYEKFDSRALVIDDKDVDEDGTGLTTVYGSVPVQTGYHLSVDVGMVDDYNRLYTFEDGVMSMAREFKQYNDAIKIMANRAIVYTNTVRADAVYSSGSIYYAEVGNCTIGVYSVNFNTAITLFGVGKEARFNICAYLRSYLE